jgi:hypothetical protein
MAINEEETNERGVITMADSGGSGGGLVARMKARRA